MKLNNHGVGSKEMFLVILIVCMILVAMVPTIINAVEHSNEEVLMNNVITFRSEVDRTILSYINGGEDIPDGCYYITSKGDICLGDYDSDHDMCTGEPLEIELKGEKPKAGTIDVASYKVSDIHNIRMENFFINLNSSKEYYVSDEPQAQVFCRK